MAFFTSGFFGDGSSGLGQSEKASEITTADATETAALSIAIPTGSVMAIEVMVLGVDSTGAKYLSAHLGALCSASAVLLPVQQIDWHNSPAEGAWAADITVTGGNVVVNVTGAVATSVKWTARANYTTVSAS